MEVANILRALRRNPMGSVLIALQIALTMAVVSNAVFFVHEQLEAMHRPSGVSEQDLVLFTNMWTGPDEGLKALLQTDLSLLRSLPGVIDAFATDGLPLSGSGFSESVNVQPDRPEQDIVSAVYPVDEHALQALDLRIVAGRWFDHDDVVDRKQDSDSPDHAPVVLITRALAARLFGGQSALGKTIYLNNGPTAVIGVVERLQTQSPAVYGHAEDQEYSVLSPYLWSGRRTLYVLRTSGGADAALALAQRKLLEVSRARVILSPRSFAQVRESAYRPLRAASAILSAIAGLLLVVATLGVLGLTSYWIGRRQRQIGIRRALGARRIDISRHVHVENLLIVGAGVAIGIVLAIAVNVFAVTHFEMSRMRTGFVLAGALMVVCGSQIGVLWPAMRAAAIPPAVAVRTN